MATTTRTYRGWKRLAPGYYTRTDATGAEATILWVPPTGNGYSAAWMLTGYGERQAHDAYRTLNEAIDAMEATA